MATINTDFLSRCIGTLDLAIEQLKQHEPGEFIYEVFRSACVKEFEIILEQSGSLLRKRLRSYFASNRQADTLVFKDVFRYAARHGLISMDACERWLEYRDHRNETAHLYGEEFAETTLVLLPRFISDAEELARVISEATDE